MKYTIVIPTMWKANKYLLTMLSKYEQCDLIREVIVIDNCYEEQLCLKEFTKVRILQQQENIYVNPAWNLGVQEAKTELIVLANDDIIIDNFELYMHFVYNNLKEGMLFGFDSNCFLSKRTKKLNGMEIIEKPVMKHGYGVFLVFHKKSYKPIPSTFEIWYGDWLLHYWLDAYSINGINVETPMRTTSRNITNRRKRLGKERRAFELILKNEEQ